MIFSTLRTLIIGIIGVIVYLLGYQYGYKHKIREIKKASIVFIICMILMVILNIIYKGKIESFKALLFVLIPLVIVTVVYFIYILLIALKQTKVENKIKEDYYKKKVNREKLRKVQREEILSLYKADKKFMRYNSIIVSVFTFTFVYLLVFLLIF